LETADLSAFSLVLVRDGEIVHRGRERGIKPLIDCLEGYDASRGRVVVWDRVVGLAAARLMVYAGFVAAVRARVASVPARDFLARHGLDLRAEEIVEAILTPDGKNVCPGEIIALETEDPLAFIREIKTRWAGYCDVPLPDKADQDFEDCRGQCGYTPWCRACKESRGLGYL